MINVATVYFDGASSPHLKNGASWAIAVIDHANDDKLLHVHSGSLDPDETNNMAELRAAVEAIKYAWGNRGIVRILGDSQVVLGWITGRTKVHHQRARPLIAVAQAYLNDRKDLTIGYVPRKKNFADKFAKEAKRA